MLKAHPTVLKILEILDAIWNIIGQTVAWLSLAISWSALFFATFIFSSGVLKSGILAVVQGEHVETLFAFYYIFISWIFLFPSWFFLKKWREILFIAWIAAYAGLLVQNISLQYNREKTISRFAGIQHIVNHQIATCLDQDRNELESCLVELAVSYRGSP